MYANEKVLESMDILRLLEYYDFDLNNLSGNILRSKCNVHGGSNPTSFVINIETGLWYCHSRGNGGDVFTLIEKLEKIDFKESVKFLANFFDVDTKGLKTSRIKGKLEKELENFTKAIKRSHTRTLERFKYNADTVGISSYRNFSKETIDRFKVVYAKSVDVMNKNNEIYKLYNRILIPIVFREKEVGFSLRKTKASDFPKWLHQPRGLLVNEILFNYDEAINKRDVVVVEGMLDVLAFHEIGVTAVCTFGAHLSHQQYVLLLQTGSNITLAYDGDKAGRKATKKAIEMLKNKANLFTVQFGEGEDPENIDRKELMEKYEGRKKC